jgi:hypothetical protein
MNASLPKYRRKQLMSAFKCDEIQVLWKVQYKMQIVSIKAVDVGIAKWYSFVSAYLRFGRVCNSIFRSEVCRLRNYIESMRRFQFLTLQHFSPECRGTSTSVRAYKITLCCNSGDHNLNKHRQERLKTFDIYTFRN